MSRNNIYCWTIGREGGGFQEKCRCCVFFLNNKPPLSDMYMWLNHIWSISAPYCPIICDSVWLIKKTIITSWNFVYSKNNNEIYVAQNSKFKLKRLYICVGFHIYTHASLALHLLIFWTWNSPNEFAINSQGSLYKIDKESITIVCINMLSGKERRSRSYSMAFQLFKSIYLEWLMF